MYLTMSLLYEREFLNFYPKSILFQHFMDTQTKTIFHRRNTSYNNGVMVQYNAAQQWWYIQYWQQTRFQILANLPKW